MRFASRKIQSDFSKTIIFWKLKAKILWEVTDKFISSFDFITT